MEHLQKFYKRFRILPFEHDNKLKSGLVASLLADSSD